MERVESPIWEPGQAEPDRGQGQASGKEAGEDKTSAELGGAWGKAPSQDESWGLLWENL